MKKMKKRQKRKPGTETRAKPEQEAEENDNKISEMTGRTVSQELANNESGRQMISMINWSLD
jgi:hypothetical protein